MNLAGKKKMRGCQGREKSECRFGGEKGEGLATLVDAVTAKSWGEVGENAIDVTEA